MSEGATVMRRSGPVIVLTIMTLGVTGAVVAQRRMPGGLARETSGMHAIGGSAQTFDTIAWTLTKIPLLAALVGCLGVVALCTRSLRRRALGAFVMMAGANVSAQATKSLLAHVLSAPAATLPSGHVVLAMSVACGIVMMCPRRWRDVGVVFGGALAALGSAGVIGAYWHVPGDVVVAELFVAWWVVAVQACLGLHRRVPARDVSLALGGVAWVLVTFAGWGSQLKHVGGWLDVTAVGTMVVLPTVAALVVALAARGLPDATDTTH